MSAFLNAAKLVVEVVRDEQMQDPSKPDGPAPSNSGKRPTGWWRTGIASAKQQSQQKALGIVSNNQTFTLEAKRKARDELRARRATEKVKAAEDQEQEAVARAARIKQMSIDENARMVEDQAKAAEMSEAAELAAAQMKEAMSKVLSEDLHGDGPAISRKTAVKRGELLAKHKAGLEGKAKFKFEKKKEAEAEEEQEAAELARKESVNFQDLSLTGLLVNSAPAKEGETNRKTSMSRRSLTISGREIEELGNRKAGTIEDVRGIVAHLGNTFNTTLLVIGKRVESAGDAVKRPGGAKKAQEPQVCLVRARCALSQPNAPSVFLFQGLGCLAAIVDSLSNINILVSTMLKQFDPSQRLSVEVDEPDDADDAMGKIKFMLSKLLSLFTNLFPKLKAHAKAGGSFEDSEKAVKLADLEEVDELCTDIVENIDLFMNWMRTTSISSTVNAVAAAVRGQPRAVLLITFENGHRSDLRCNCHSCAGNARHSTRRSPGWQASQCRQSQRTAMRPRHHPQQMHQMQMHQMQMHQPS